MWDFGGSCGASANKFIKSFIVGSFLGYEGKNEKVWITIRCILGYKCIYLWYLRICLVCCNFKWNCGVGDNWESFSIIHK